MNQFISLIILIINIRLIYSELPCILNPHLELLKGCRQAVNTNVLKTFWKSYKLCSKSGQFPNYKNECTSQVCYLYCASDWLGLVS